MCDYLQTLRLRANWNYKRLVARAASVTGRIFAPCRAGCALWRIGACSVFAETLRWLVARFCAKKKPGRSPRRCPGGVHSFLIFTPSLRAEVVDSPCLRAKEMQLRRRIESVECRAVRRLGREAISRNATLIRRSGESRKATLFEPISLTSIQRLERMLIIALHKQSPITRSDKYGSPQP